MMNSDIEWWHHDCPDSGPTDTLIGQDCNWCEAKSPKMTPKQVEFLEKWISDISGGVA